MQIINNSNSQLLQEAARNSAFFQQQSAATTTAAQQKTVRSSAEAKITPEVLSRVIGSQTGSALQTGNLSNLREKLDDGLVSQVKDAGVRFQENNFGQVQTGAATSLLGGLRDQASTHSRNPIGDVTSQLVTSRNAMVSEDPSTSETDKESDNFSEVDGALAAMGAMLGDIGGFFFGVLTANTGSPADKGDEFNGWSALFNARENGSMHQQAGDYLNKPDGTPLPDDMGNSSGPTIVTQDMLNALKAMKGSASQPTGDDQGTGGGPINTGVKGTGGKASVSEPVRDSEVSTNVAVTARDLQDLQARILSKIQIVR